MALVGGEPPTQALRSHGTVPGDGRNQSSIWRFPYDLEVTARPPHERRTPGSARAFRPVQTILL